ncbi:MAG: flagellar M-ring protein FliF [Elusimicrobia bacterium]|nr:flagellar M-ring protein FliF [Elusimicrobiota bacterium]
MESLIRLKDLFFSLPVGRKAMVLIFAAAVSGAVYALSLPMRGLDQTPLYARLSPIDAAQVVEKLRNDGVDYRLTNGGRTVNVPSRMVDELRLKLSQEGLPKGEGEGLEILEKSPLGMSDFSQKVGYQRAIQGELARTIGALENVHAARVHLVFPEESPFLDSQDGARASVVLTLKAGASIDQRQLSGIVHLVAGGVKDLKPENVSILDSHGRLLAGGRSSDGVYSHGNELLDLQRDAERYLEQKTTSLLDGFLGPGKAIVRTRVEMDDRIVREKTETYDPNTPLRSEQQTSVPRTGPSFVKNYEVGRSVKEIVASPGAIRRLYVSVVIDGTNKEDPATPGARTYVARSEEEMNAIGLLVKQTVGFSEDREDQFEIKNVAFDTAQRDKMVEEAAAQEEVLKKERTRQTLMLAIGRGGSALAIVMVLILFMKFLKAAGASTNNAPPNTNDTALLAAPVLAAATPPPPASTGGAEGGVPSPKELPTLNSSQAQAALLDAARKDPAGVARVMQKKFAGRASA